MKRLNKKSYAEDHTRSEIKSTAPNENRTQVTTKLLSISIPDIRTEG